MKIKEILTEEVPLGKYLYHITMADNLISILKDGLLGYPGDIISMTADRHYSVSEVEESQVQIILDANKVKQLDGFEKHVDNWELATGGWAKDPEDDTESEYRLIDGDAVPLSHFLAIRLSPKYIPKKQLEMIKKLAQKKNIPLITRSNMLITRDAGGPRSDTTDLRMNLTTG